MEEKRRGHMRYSLIFWILGITASFAACTNRDATPEKELSTDEVYFDYKINGDDESGEMTAVLQFRYGGRDGETLLLNEPSSVQLDEETLEADSAEQSGVFYETRKPVSEFEGEHDITFTDLKGKKFEEHFSFVPFSFAGEIENTMKRSNLVFPVNGLKNGDEVRVILIDTSFATDDLNGIATVNDGNISITKEQLRKVANGPVTLQLYKEETQKIKNGTAEGGILSIAYAINKEFLLAE